MRPGWGQGKAPESAQGAERYTPARPRLAVPAIEAYGVVPAQPIRGPGEPIHSEKKKKKPEKERGAARSCVEVWNTHTPRGAQ